MEYLEPSDVEQATIDELEPFFPNQVGTSLPKTMPAFFIRVVAVGGFERDLVSDEWLITLEVFAGRETIAINGANRAIAILQAAKRSGKLGNEVCYGMRVATLPQNYALPSVPGHKRYLTTLAPTLRRRVVTL